MTGEKDGEARVNVAVDIRHCSREQTGASFEEENRIFLGFKAKLYVNDLSLDQK